MKATKIAIISAVLLLTAGFLMAQNTLVIEGTVAPTTTISCDLPWGSTVSGFDLSTVGAHNVDIAEMTEISNNALGYVVTITSANGLADRTNYGFFKGATVGNSDYQQYTLTYGGQALSFTAGSASRSFGSKTDRDGNVSVVNISYTVDNYLNADTYFDTLTFSIAAN